MLCYATATVLTLLFRMYVVCSLQLRAHVLLFPETDSPDVSLGLWKLDDSALVRVLQINLNQILFDLLQYQRTISELMVIVPVYPNCSW